MDPSLDTEQLFIDILAILIGFCSLRCVCIGRHEPAGPD